jgi:hypothetical protein
MFRWKFAFVVVTDFFSAAIIPHSILHRLFHACVVNGLFHLAQEDDGWRF